MQDTAIGEIANSRHDFQQSFRRINRDLGDRPAVVLDPGMHSHFPDPAKKVGKGVEPALVRERPLDLLVVERLVHGPGFLPPIGTGFATTLPAVLTWTLKMPGLALS